MMFICCHPVSECGWPSQNTADWGFKQQTPIPHSSGSWKSEIRVPVQLDSGEDPVPGCVLPWPSLVSA